MRAIAAALLSAMALLVACHPEAPPIYQRPGRVLVIGIDGASPRVVDELRVQGRLPNLEAIARRGAAGRIRAHKPIVSPRIWNSVATGMAPEKHGIASFTFQEPGGTKRLYSSKDRKVQTLWGIVSQAGMRVGVVNFWNTYPPEKVNGVMVSDHLLARELEGFAELLEAEPPQSSGSVIYPSEWNARLTPLVREAESPVPEVRSPFADGAVLPRWVDPQQLQRRFSEDAALARITQEIVRESNPELMMLLMPGIDRIQHYLWGVLEPPESYSPDLRPTAEGRAGGKRALFAYYEYTDQLIGALMRDYGPDDLIIVLSDHGFEVDEAYLTVTGGHDTDKAIFGIAFAQGPGIAPGSRIESLSVNDVTPTILTWMGLPTSVDMDGRPAKFLDVAAQPPVERSSTAAIEYLETVEEVSAVESSIVDDLRALGYIQD